MRFDPDFGENDENFFRYVNTMYKNRANSKGIIAKVEKRLDYVLCNMLLYI